MATNNSGKFLNAKIKKNGSIHGKVKPFTTATKHQNPFMRKPLVDLSRNSAEDKVSQAVINSTFQTPVDTPKYVFEFLEILVIPDTIRELGPVDLTPSCEENKTG